MNQTLPYELARRHYQIQRILELDPGTQGYPEIAGILDELPVSALLKLFDATPEIYCELIPLRLLAEHFQGFDPELASPRLTKALEDMYTGFSGPLQQELERLIQEQKLARYLYARCLLLDEIHFQNSLAPMHMGVFDRDLFRQYLSGYCQIVRGGVGNPHLLALWAESNWLSRWQLGGDKYRHPLPVQMSPRQSIAKYKLSEQGRRLYAELEQGITHQESFLAKIPEVLQSRLADSPLDLNDQIEPAIREVVQIGMRHGVKKGFRIQHLSSLLLQTIVSILNPQTDSDQKLIVYTCIQELLLGTLNLKYRLNDALAGISLALSELNITEAVMLWAQHAVMDSVMEIYESFSLADNALKSFMEQYQQFFGQQIHRDYQLLETKLITALS